MAGLFSNMIVSPNPLETPLPWTCQRLYGCLDLFNSGFYNEAFISAFALLDDSIQNVVEAGLGKRGLNAGQQRSLMSAIERERLKHYTCTLMPLCGWESLEVANPPLCKKLVGKGESSCNKKRNAIVHGDLRLSREEAREQLRTITEVLQWLDTNPFGFSVPTPTRTFAAESDFVIFDEDGNQVEPPLKHDETDAGVQRDEAPASASESSEPAKG